MKFRQALSAFAVVCGVVCAGGLAQAQAQDPAPRDGAARSGTALVVREASGIYAGTSSATVEFGEPDPSELGRHIRIRLEGKYTRTLFFTETRILQDACGSRKTEASLVLGSLSPPGYESWITSLQLQDHRSRICEDRPAERLLVQIQTERLVRSGERIVGRLVLAPSVPPAAEGEAPSAEPRGLDCPLGYGPSDDNLIILIDEEDSSRGLDLGYQVQGHFFGLKVIGCKELTLAAGGLFCDERRIGAVEKTQLELNDDIYNGPRARLRLAERHEFSGSCRNPRRNPLTITIR